MTEPVQEFSFSWHGIDIDIMYQANWSQAMSDGYGFPMAHIAIKAAGRVALPITSTGYKSDFQPSNLIDDGGGVVAYVESWLDVAALDPKWIDHADLSRQEEMF